MQLTSRDGEFVFRKLQVEEVASTHHVRAFVVIDGKRVLPLYYSRGRKAFPGQVSQLFRKSMHLSEIELRDFLACRMSREQYLALLATRLGKPEVSRTGSDRKS